MLDKSVDALPSIGPKLKALYAKQGIETVRDLLLSFPHRYDDFRTVEGIRNALPGSSTTIRGTVTSIRSRRSPRKRMNLAEATIEDETGTITAVWFHQSYIAKQIKVGDMLSLSGKVDDKYGLSMMNPQFEKLQPGRPTAHTGRIVPVYSVTNGMAQKGRRNAIRAAMSHVENIEDWIPSDVLSAYDLAFMKDAIPELHFPVDENNWDRAMRRLKFGELLTHQLLTVRSAKEARSLNGRPVALLDDEVRKMVNVLPYALTNAQRKAAFEIATDMTQNTPMRRLLEGDVGAGKTAVAALIAGNVAKNGAQTAYLAPTEILAVQLAHSFMEILGENVSVALLTASNHELNGIEVKRKEILDGLLDGRIDVVIGTHALLTKDVMVPELALVVVDEQHRFGVEQRKALLKENDQGFAPHFLAMTATPIPRTLAMTLFGDMDISILDELPAGRGDVETILLSPKQEGQAYDLMAGKLATGTQAYVVCPFIQDSDSSEAESVEVLVESLKKGALRAYKVEALHGRMKPKEKSAVMDRFVKGRTHVIVSTTVIEVGVNVPNATVMFIEGAERFGLAQLHQLRGRVRRSTSKATCFLHPTSMSGVTKERMEAMIKHDSGFELAEIDLKLRGAGDRFGTRQSGIEEFMYASLSDHVLIAQAREAAEKMSEEGIADLIQDELTKASEKTLA